MDRSLLAAGIVIFFLLDASMVAVHGGQDIDGWPWENHGGGLWNRREAVNETKISTDSISSLSLKWEFIAGFDVTATPAIADEVIYFPSNNGNIYAVKEETGDLIWERNLTELTAGIPAIANAFALPKIAGGLYHMHSRSTPAVSEQLLVLGIFGPCAVIAVNRSDGSLVWSRTLDTQKYSVVTQGATIFESAVYIGTSSGETNEEVCCTFQGAFFKLALATGDIVWKVPMLPDNGGKTGLYAGVAVWGSSPAIDVVRRVVYIGTGNAYSVPPSVYACESAFRNHSHPGSGPTDDPCIIAASHQESVLAVDIDTGNITWARHLGGYDALGWTYICFLYGSYLVGPSCPPSTLERGGDSDFGEAPMLLTINGRDVVIAGQKSGDIYSLDRETGESIWTTAAGPGGLGGGSVWGMTTDGQRVFTNSLNTNMLNFTLLPGTQNITYGGWVALDATNGSILWSTANTQRTVTTSPLTYANGVVFGGSFGIPTLGAEVPGQVVALEATTGKVLWTYNVTAILCSGVSIWNGCAYVGVGTTYNFGVAYPSPKNHGNSTLALCV